MIDDRFMQKIPYSRSSFYFQSVSVCRETLYRKLKFWFRKFKKGYQISICFYQHQTCDNENCIFDHKYLINGIKKSFLMVIILFPMSPTWFKSHFDVRNSEINITLASNMTKHAGSAEIIPYLSWTNRKDYSLIFCTDLLFINLLFASLELFIILRYWLWFINQ